MIASAVIGMYGIPHIAGVVAKNYNENIVQKAYNRHLEDSSNFPVRFDYYDVKEIGEKLDNLAKKSNAFGAFAGLAGAIGFYANYKIRERRARKKAR